MADMSEARNAGSDPPDSASAEANDASYRSPREDRAQSKTTGKARKPYTITRARERWSDEEHVLFLEGMKLHGRCWGRVAEHVRSKTTIQIRSHAQKYFNRVKRMQEAQPNAVMATDDPVTGCHPALQSWQKPARAAAATPRAALPEMPACDKPVDASFKRAAEIVAAAATEAAAAAASAVVSAAGTRIREHMDLLQAQQGTLSAQMQAPFQAAQQSALLAQAQASGMLPPTMCNGCQASTANGSTQLPSQPVNGQGSSHATGATSTLSQGGLASISSQGTHTGLTNGTAPSSNTDSINTVPNPNPLNSNPFGLPGAGLSTLGADLEAHIVQQAMQRVSVMFGAPPMPTALSPGMQAASLGLLNPHLLQAQLAASGMPLGQPKPAPPATAHSEMPPDQFGSTNAV